MKVFSYPCYRFSGHCNNYLSVDSRYKTYEKWPVGLQQTPEELVTAGCYYSGHGDRVLCSYCFYGFCDWTPEDCPVIRHLAAVPHCSFIQSVALLHYKVECKYCANRENSAKKVIEKNADSVMICKICFLNVCDIVFLPCRHFVSCRSCASQLDKCAICRGSIKNTLTVFTC